MGHHTKEQVAAGFARAPEILRKLEEAGVHLPHFELFSDASGVLVLGENVTKEQYALACDLIHSQRPSFAHGGEIAIAFCCGLVPS